MIKTLSEYLWKLKVFCTIWFIDVSYYRQGMVIQIRITFLKCCIFYSPLLLAIKNISSVLLKKIKVTCNYLGCGFDDFQMIYNYRCFDFHPDSNSSEIVNRLQLYYFIHQFRCSWINPAIKMPRK